MKLNGIPYAVTGEPEGLNYLACEVTYGATWVSLNTDQFRINAQETLDNSRKGWRKITAQSPILGGDYLVHAVPDMVTETVSVWVHGTDQSDLADNRHLLEMLFEQFDFRMRWTFNEYREYWQCQLAEATVSRGQVWSHNQMALMSFVVPRYPEVTRERIA